MAMAKLWGKKDGQRGFIYSHVKSIYYNWKEQKLLSEKLDEMDKATEKATPVFNAFDSFGEPGEEGKLYVDNSAEPRKIYTWDTASDAYVLTGGAGGNDIISDEFSTDKVYEIGDYCIYNNTLYRFKNKHEAGEWTEDDVEATKVDAELSALNAKIDIFASFVNDYLNKFNKRITISKVDAGQISQSTYVYNFSVEEQAAVYDEISLEGVSVQSYCPVPTSNGQFSYTITDMDNGTITGTVRGVYSSINQTTGTYLYNETIKIGKKIKSIQLVEKIASSNVSSKFTWSGTLVATVRKILD